jgi:uncharacterized protein (TIGR00288 family)
MSNEQTNINEQGVALFIDHYNILNGCKNKGIVDYNYDVLIEVAKKMGRIVFGRVYLLTGRESERRLDEFFKRGIEPIYAPEYIKKSLADPMIICDIMEVLYERPFIQTFIIVSGDKDFIPVIRKISEHGKSAIIIAVGNSTADAIIEECSRLNFKFLAYETIHRKYKRGAKHLIK